MSYLILVNKVTPNMNPPCDLFKLRFETDGLLVRCQAKSVNSRSQSRFKTNTDLKNFKYPTLLCTVVKGFRSPCEKLHF